VATVTTKPPIMKRGGGSLTTWLSAAANRARDGVRPLLLADVRKVVERSVSKAGPGTNRDGWPIGPERPWDRTWKGHSYLLFRTREDSRGWYLRIRVENPADYTHFIHEPGNSRNVLDREILGPLRRAALALKPKVREAVIRGFRDGR
jgi:hypothetical protein